MINQPTKQEFHTFFDVVNHLANFENNNFKQTGLSIFPGLPRPIPEVLKVMGWIHSVITAPDLPPEQEVSVTGFETSNLPPGRKKPGPKPKVKGSPGRNVLGPVPVPQIPASASMVAGTDASLAQPPKQPLVLPNKTPTPDELPDTILKPGADFNYANEVKGTVLIIPDDPTIMSNPEGFANVP